MRLCIAASPQFSVLFRRCEQRSQLFCREGGMRKLILMLGVAPLLAGTAMAAQPLTENQMDGVIAGFSAYSTADALASIVPGAPALTQMQPICPSCFEGPILQLGIGLDLFQSIGIMRPGLP
jgi:hypothetical protein